MSVTYRIIAIVAVMGTAVVAVSAIATSSTLRLERAITGFGEASTRGEAMVAVERSVSRMFDAAEDLRESTMRSEAAPHLRRIDEAVGDLEKARAVLRGIDGGEDAFRSLDAALLDYAGAMTGVAAALGGRSGAAGAAMLSGREARAALRGVRERLDVYRDRETARLRDQVAGSAAVAGQAIVLVLSGSAVALVAGVAFSLWVALRQIRAPLTDLMIRVRHLERGDYATAFPATSRRDEIGALTGAVATLREKLLENARAAEAHRREREEQKRKRAAEIEKLVVRLETDVEGVVRALSASAQQLSSSAGVLRESARRSGEKIGVVSGAMEDATGNVQAVASAAEELAATAQEISTQVAQSTTITMDALQKAERATEIVGGLSSSARRIGQVVDLIEDIASQTNLLALNATIEAARAGDAGKGFAVVAMEVKSLAEQTAGATKEISTQIGAVQSDVALVVEAIETLKDSFGRANELASSVASAIEEQSAATGAIAQNVTQAAVSTQDVSTNIVDVSKAANDTGRNADEIVAAAGEVSGQATTLSTRMAGFIDFMRRDAA